MSHNVQGQTNRIYGLAALAGTIYGAFLSGQLFGGSWVALGLGAFIGLAILSPVFAQMALITAGVLMGMSGIIGPTWTEHHERLAQRIATILLVLIIASGIFGLLFAL